MNYKELLNLFYDYMSQGATSFKIRVIGRTELVEINSEKELKAWWRKNFKKDKMV